ncbi:hypothetical protein [Streptomyces sp. CBMA152]|uniref:hypothetical protein n=1 Tax=Streptomyces sp. CBMA152 TaxID=1896312 RepID=UPI0016615FA9|nr:hypothetical protein [Streptomyces sp. CBMA152]
MKSVINTLKSQNVSLIELDTISSNWLTDQEFAQHLGKGKKHAAAAQFATTATAIRRMRTPVTLWA